MKPKPISYSLSKVARHYSRLCRGGFCVRFSDTLGTITATSTANIAFGANLFGALPYALSMSKDLQIQLPLVVGSIAMVVLPTDTQKRLHQQYNEIRVSNLRDSYYESEKHGGPLSTRDTFAVHAYTDGNKFPRRTVTRALSLSDHLEGPIFIAVTPTGQGTGQKRSIILPINHSSRIESLRVLYNSRLDPVYKLPDVIFE